MLDWWDQRFRTFMRELKLEYLKYEELFLVKSNGDLLKEILYFKTG